MNVFPAPDQPTVESLAGEMCRGGVASFFTASQG
jgi:hypothetical protein